MTRTRTSWRSLARGLSIELAARAVKVALVGGVVFGVISAASTRVEAGIHDAFLELGAKMVRYDNAGYQDAPREVVLNGSSIALSTGSSDDPVAVVLDRFAAACKSPGDALRRVTDEAGYVACVDGIGFGGGEGLAKAAVKGRLAEVVANLRSGELGLRRYFYATRRGGETYFFTLWAEDGLDANRLFPDGESPGADLPGLPRPGGVVRTFSIGETGKPYGLAVYNDPERSPAELEQYYLDELRAAGWTLRPEAEGVGRTPLDLDPSRHAFVAARGNAIAVVIARQSGDHSVLALALGE